MAKYGILKNPVDILEEVALRHKVIRKQIGLSQTLLAERSGVSLGSIKRFERTGQNSLISLLALAHISNRLDDFEFIFKPMDHLKEIAKLFSDKTRR